MAATSLCAETPWPDRDLLCWSAPENLRCRGVDKTGLAGWGLPDFDTAVRTGINRAGEELDPSMPFQSNAAFSDDEINAMWTYIQTVPSLEFGARQGRSGARKNGASRAWCTTHGMLWMEQDTCAAGVTQSRLPSAGPIRTSNTGKALE